MNEYQKENIDVWNKNLPVMKRCADGDLRYWSSIYHGNLFRCVSCGERKINSLIVKFFGSPEKLKCYECQKNNK